MTPTESNKLEPGSRVRNGWMKGWVTQTAPAWFMVHWEHTDIPQIIKRNPVTLKHFHQIA